VSFDFSGTWIRPTPAGLAQLRTDYEDGAVDVGGGWFRIELRSASSAERIPEIPVGCSRAYGETVFLLVSAIVAAFEYVHALDGVALRHMRYVDGVWEVAAGAPEPWEPELLRGDIAVGAGEPFPRVEHLAMDVARRSGFRLFD
jgi:hypothetical protein